MNIDDNSAVWAILNNAKQKTQFIPKYRQSPPETDTKLIRNTKPSDKGKKKFITKSYFHWMTIYKFENHDQRHEIILFPKLNLTLSETWPLFCYSSKCFGVPYSLPPYFSHVNRDANHKRSPVHIGFSVSFIQWILLQTTDTQPFSQHLKFCANPTSFLFQLY